MVEKMGKNALVIILGCLMLLGTEVSCGVKEAATVPLPTTTSIISPTEIAPNPVILDGLMDKVWEKVRADETSNNISEKITIENKILKVFLSGLNENDKFPIIINPEVKVPLLDVSNNYTMEYLSEWASSIPDCDLFTLVEKYNKLNSEIKTLTIKSFSGDGFYINYDNRLEKYTAEITGGYYDQDKKVVVISAENAKPLKHDFTISYEGTDVSMPSYDEDTGYVLIYCYQIQGVEGVGALNFMKYDHGTLYKIRSKKIVSVLMNIPVNMPSTE
jgi:hypothetical protein